MRSIVILCAACGSSGHSTAVDARGGDAVAPVEDVHLIGRFDAMQSFAWPGTQIATRFTGNAIAIDLEDSGASWFVATIDGTAQPSFLAPAGRATTTLASGLAAGPHDLVLARRTESFLGPTTFHGFPGATLVATPRPARLIEMIGDSITCGYGVLGVGPNCSFTAATEDETAAWGALAATDLGAVHAAIAYSGIGMYRDNGGDTTMTMPVRYSRTFADDPNSTWDWSYTPDVVVIDLGTNEFAGGDPGQPFADTYTAFVHMLRAKFPATVILLATSPMLDGTARTQLRGYLDVVVAALADPKVSVVDIAEQLAADGYGCDYHPDTTTQRKMADALVPAIRAATGW